MTTDMPQAKNTKKQNFLKLVSLQAVAGLIASFALHRFTDWDSVNLTMFMMGFLLMGMLAAVLIERRYLPRPILLALQKIRATSLSDVMWGAVSLLRAYPLLFVLLGMVVTLSQVAPEVGTIPESAQTVYSVVSKFGTSWLLLGLTYQGLRVIFTQADSVSCIPRFLERLLLLAVGLFLVRMLGSELNQLLAWVKHNPDTTLAVVAGVLIVFLIYGFATSTSISQHRDHGETTPGRLSGARVLPRTLNDIHRTAVHEAGHLIMFADLPELPRELKVTVLAEISAKDTYRGQVMTSEDLWPAVHTEGFLRWVMLMRLAGAEAEFVCLGERADGANGDNTHWLHTATSYLTSGFGEVFYSEPVGEAQIAHNRSVLNDLKAGHVAELGRRLAVNKAVLDELAAAIGEKRTMSRKEIKPYLSRVIKPELATMSSPAIQALTDIWTLAGHAGIEFLRKGTAVWHSGLITTMAEMDDHKALWTTRSADCQTTYCNSARADSAYAKKPAALLMMTLNTDLRAADFNSASLLKFTQDYCNSSHDQMKATLRAWCIHYKFDAVVRLNSDATEVVVVKPATSLSLITSQPL